MVGSLVEAENSRSCLVCNKLAENTAKKERNQKIETDMREESVRVWNVGSTGCGENASVNHSQSEQRSCIRQPIRVPALYTHSVGPHFLARSHLSLLPTFATSNRMKINRSENDNNIKKTIKVSTCRQCGLHGEVDTH